MLDGLNHLINHRNSVSIVLIDSDLQEEGTAEADSSEAAPAEGEAAAEEAAAPVESSEAAPADAESEAAPAAAEESAPSEES